MSIFEEKEQPKVPSWVHIPIAIFVLISFYETGKGFTPVLGSVLGWGFSFGLAFILFIMNKKFAENIVNKRSIKSLFIFYCFCCVFSFAGNYSGMFNYFLNQSIYQNELKHHLEQVDDVYNRAVKAIDNFDPVTAEKINRVHALSDQLRLQITDPARPGLGQRARELIAEIEGILGEKLTEFGATSKPEALAERYQENINQIVQRTLNSGDNKRATDLKAQVEQEYNRIRATIHEALGYSKGEALANNYKVNITVVSEINNLIAVVKEFINDPKKFDYETVKFESADIGQFGFIFDKTVNEYFGNGIIIAFLALFIDFCSIVLFAVMLNDASATKPKRKSSSRDL